MIKPEALLVTDSHMDKDNTDTVLAVLKQAVDYCVDNDIKYLFHLGDSFTNRTGQNLTVLLAFDDFLWYARKKGIIVYLIPGNHDKMDLESEESYLDIYRNHEGVNVIKSSAVKTVGNVTFAFLPYFKENGSYPERLAKLAEEMREDGEIEDTHWALCTHIAVDGVRNNDGSEVINKLGKSAFEDFDVVYVGHYHNRSRVGNRIRYIGSALAQNYGEDNEKGFTVVYSDGSDEFIQSKFKKFIKIKLDVDELSNKQLIDLREEYSGSEDNVRFIIEGSEERLQMINQEDFAQEGIEIKKSSKNVIKSINAAESGEFIEYDKKTITKEFFKFCKEAEITPVDRKKGLEYLKKM